MPIEASETQLVYAILEYLAIRRIEAWRANTGVMPRTNKAGKTRYVHFGRPGQCDISGILPDGRRLEIEVKRPGQKPTTEQKEFMAMVARNRGVSFVAYGIDEVRQVLDGA